MAADMCRGVQRPPRAPGCRTTRGPNRRSAFREGLRRTSARRTRRAAGLSGGPGAPALSRAVAPTMAFTCSLLPRGRGSPCRRGCRTAFPGWGKAVSWSGTSLGGSSAGRVCMEISGADGRRVLRLVREAEEAGSVEELRERALLALMELIPCDAGQWYRLGRLPDHGPRRPLPPRGLLPRGPDGDLQPSPGPPADRGHAPDTDPRGLEGQRRGRGPAVAAHPLLQPGLPALRDAPATSSPRAARTRRSSRGTPSPAAAATSTRGNATSSASRSSNSRRRNATWPSANA